MDPILCQTIQDEHAKRCQWNQTLILNVNDSAEANLDLSCSVINNAFAPKNDTQQPSPSLCKPFDEDNLGTSTPKHGTNQLSPSICPPCAEDNLDLSCSVGKDAFTPTNNTNQPFPSLYPPSLVFRFPIEFQGPEAVDDINIKKLLERGCSGRELFSQKDGHGLNNNNNRYELRCKHYNVQNMSPEEDFVEGNFSKQNMKTETVKVQRSKNGQPAYRGSIITKITWCGSTMGKFKHPRPTRTKPNSEL